MTRFGKQTNTVKPRNPWFGPGWVTSKSTNLTKLTSNNVRADTRIHNRQRDSLRGCHSRLLFASFQFDLPGVSTFLGATLWALLCLAA
jgi:hypothetical protein